MTTPQAPHRIAPRLALFAALFLLVAAGVQALQFTVTLKNGTTFETRYRPVEAEWDPHYSMFLTDTGNWIALPDSEIADIVSHAEESGFGYQVDTTTLFLGWSPNDLADAETEDGEPRYDFSDTGGGGGGGDYSIEQFLNTPSFDPGATGGGAGIPVGEVGAGDN